ncbi:MAG: hypothetical protein FWF05_09170 [Oscillospiraceae bacterium]|nr:hypothetical protein [Oscillospiraceae bacterium]
MDKHNTCLSETIRKLYTRAGQVNLYMQLRYRGSDSDIQRLKAEIKKIKQLVDIIEKEIDNL